MSNHIIAAVLHGFYQACAGVIVFLLALALLRYRAYKE
jgi:hypothetical protein